MAQDASGCSSCPLTISSACAVARAETNTAAGTYISHSNLDLEEQRNARRKKRFKDATLIFPDQQSSKINRRVGTPKRSRSKMSCDERYAFTYPSVNPVPTTPCDDRLAELIRVAESHLLTTDGQKRQSSTRNHFVSDNDIPLDWSSYFGAHIDSQTSFPSAKRITEVQDACPPISHCDDCQTTVDTCPAVEVITGDQCCTVPCPVTAQTSQASSSCMIPSTICCEEPHHLMANSSSILACADAQCSDGARVICNDLDCVVTGQLPKSTSSLPCLTACAGNEASGKPNVPTDGSSTIDVTATCPTCEGSPSSRMYSSFQELVSAET